MCICAGKDARDGLDYGTMTNFFDKADHEDFGLGNLVLER